MKRVLDYNSHSFTYNIINNRIVNLKGLGYLDLLYLNKNRKKIECYILRIKKEMQFYQNYFSKIKINFWLISSLLISSLICVPILIILSSFFTELSGYYKLLTETYLYTYVINTVILFIGVILFSFVFGVGIAYLVSFYIFPGSKFITWAIILSLQYQDTFTLTH